MDLEILNIMKKRFHIIVIPNEKYGTILRSSISNSEEAHEFLNIISTHTKTDWIVYRNHKSPERWSFSKKWLCHHNKRHKRPIEFSKRNTGCTAFVDIIIKKISKDTRYKDKFLKLSPPMPAIIKLNLQHNHPIKTVDSMRMRRVSDEVKNAFYQYFEDGFSATEAASYHAAKIVREMSIESLADVKLNPTTYQVRYLFHKWKKDYRPVDPFQKLKEKSSIYEDSGTSMHFDFIDSDEEWAILIVTSIMKKTHKLHSSSEIIFVDTTVHVQCENLMLTIFFTVTKVGAVPIAVLLHKKQTTSNYEKAFRLLQNKYPRCFGGKKAPAVFMTDDSVSKKSSLSCIWPASKQLLSHFHVGQVQWCWLFTNADKNDRHFLMKLFQKVMHAKTEESVNAALNSIINLNVKHQNFTKRILQFMNRKKEWLTLFRLDMITRNHNTNNFAEVSIRILKDIVLQKMKASNIVYLCDYLISIFNEYLVKTFLDYAYNRNNKGYVIYKSYTEQVDKILSDKIIQVSDHIFYVPSTTAENKYYEVYTDLGICSCLSGIAGGFCKHLWLLEDTKKINLLNIPLVNAEDCHLLGMLVLGDSFQKRGIFADSTKPVETTAATDCMVKIENGSMDIIQDHTFTTSENPSGAIFLISQSTVEEMTAITDCMVKIENTSMDIIQDHTFTTSNNHNGGILIISQPTVVENPQNEISLLTSQEKYATLNVILPSISQSTFQESVQNGTKFASDEYKIQLLSHMEELCKNDIPLNIAQEIETFLRTIKSELSLT